MAVRPTLVALLLVLALIACTVSPSPVDYGDGGSVQPWGTADGRSDTEPEAYSQSSDLAIESETDAWVVPQEYCPPDGLEIVFLDVGQGDSILVRFPEGSTMLVDGGNKSAAQWVILPYFDKLMLERLDYLVPTHPDADHVGGLDDVVNEVEIGEVWENGQTNDTWAWLDFSDAVDAHGVPRIKVQRGYERDVDGCRVEVLNADEGWDDFNSNSIVIAVDCEGVSVLLTGDATAGTQTALVEEFGVHLESDVVKIPHHGSSDYYGGFAATVLPKAAVCSVGSNNAYGHPDKDVISSWLATGAHFYRTDEVGTVTIQAKDGNMTIETEW